MEQSTQTYNDPQIATQAKNLTKAIFQHESGMNYNAKGDAGTSQGAGQWQSATWKAQAKDVLGDENAPMTKDNQSVVAQGTIRKLISQGKNAAQIAAIWNSGSDKGWENKVGTTTINGQQIKYNVPKYVKDVTDLYQQYKNDTQPTQQQTPQSTPEQTQTDNRDLLQKTGDVVNSIFPGKQIGQAIGTLGGLAFEKAKGLFGGQDNSKYYDISAPTPLQVAGDVAQAGLMVAPGLGSIGAFGKIIPALPEATSVLGRIGQASALGAGFNATGALKEGETNVGNITKQGLIGGLIGGVTGGAGELVSKIASTLPSRLVNNFIPKLNEDTTQYAINKGLSSPKNMLAESDTSIASLGSNLGKILGKTEYKGINITGKDLYQRFAEKYPNSGLLPDQFFNELKKVSGLQKGLVNKLATPQGLSLQEVQKLNSEIGGNVFKSVLDNPEVKTNKQLGSNVYHSIGDFIRSIAPETNPIYSNLSKEYQLNSGLQKALNSSRKSKLLSMKDILGIVAGIPGGFGTSALGYGIAKASENPTLNLKTAGLLNKLANPIVGETARKGILPYLLKQTSNITNP